MVLNVQQLGMPEEIRMLRDPHSGLEGVIVVHSTALGPAAGGCRLWHYASSDQMVTDAMRLAEGMSYKNALAGLPLGGGKAVLRRPEGAFSRDELFRAFGRAVAELEGRYLTAEDVGTSVDDMKAVALGTRHVAGLPPRDGRPGGDPSPWTARGVFLSMEEAVRQRLSRNLSDCTVAIQGLGHVGTSLARMLHAAGARLIVADISGASVERVVAETKATVMPPAEILAADANVFAPCALGAVLNETDITRLKAKVVCGAANNQLATDEDGDRLVARDILYAPDYVANAGGIINVAAEYLGWSGERAERLVGETGQRLKAVLQRAGDTGLPPHRAADVLARSLIVQETQNLLRERA